MVEGGHDIIQIFKRTRWRLYSIIRPATTTVQYSNVFLYLFTLIFTFFLGGGELLMALMCQIYPQVKLFKIEQNPDVNNLNMYTKEMIF